MARTKNAKNVRSRTRLSTPPGMIIKTSQKHVQTPTRSAILAVLYFAQEKGLQCTLSDINSVFNVPERTAKRIKQQGEPRRLGHVPDAGPDPRGPHRRFTHSDSEAIASYLDSCGFERRGDSWEEIAINAGVKGEFDIQTIRRHVTKETGIHTCIAAKKEALQPHHHSERVSWAEAMLQRDDLINLAFSDEIHWCIGSRYVKRIKRRPGERFHQDCIQYDKDARKPVKSIATQEGHDYENFHVFCLLGYNYKRFIPYKSTNSNGKMTTAIYIDQILPQIKDELRERGLILYQDRDSAHTSSKTIRYLESNGIDFVNSPAKSPDLSVMETWVAPLRRKFYARRTASVSVGERRFEECLLQLNQCRINENILLYHKRLREVLRKEGRMTRY
jgi:hypothetical protein